jgi:hypothetical protein
VDSVIAGALAAVAKWTLPAAQHGSNRMLYCFAGESLTTASESGPAQRSITLRADANVTLETGSEAAQLLLLRDCPACGWAPRATVKMIGTKMNQ